MAQGLSQMPQLRGYGRRQIGIIALGLVGLTLGIFAIWPGLDEAVTAVFYRNGRFPIARNPVVEALRNGLWNLTILVFVITVLASIYGAVTKRALFGLGLRHWLYFSAVFAVGPGVLVNGILKSHWGRARPDQTEAFGGTALFTPPWQISDQCAANCSFVSGEVAGATALAIVMIVAARQWRDHLSRGRYRLMIGIAAVLPLASGLQRVAAGRHFVSDCICAALFTVLVAVVLHRLILPPRPKVALTPR